MFQVDSAGSGGLSEFIVQRAVGTRWIDVSVLGTQLTAAQAVHIADSVGGYNKG